MMSDVKDILIAVQSEQSKYRYDFCCEMIYEQKQKYLKNRYSVVKYHKEIENGKRIRIKDDAVTSNKLLDVLNYLLQEHKSFS